MDGRCLTGVLEWKVRVCLSRNLVYWSAWRYVKETLSIHKGLVGEHEGLSLTGYFDRQIQRVPEKERISLY